jgi:hypothetical protein
MDQGEVFELKLSCPFGISLEEFLAHGIGFAGEKIGKNRDHTLAAEGKNGNDLIVVSGINIDLILAKVS